MKVVPLPEGPGAASWLIIAISLPSAACCVGHGSWQVRAHMDQWCWFSSPMLVGASRSLDVTQCTMENGILRLAHSLF
jgi:hypothetical protein